MNRRSRDNSISANYFSMGNRYAKDLGESMKFTRPKKKEL
jgi:hypothetical protein